MQQQHERRVIQLDELRAHSHYNDLADLAVIFDHQVIEDDAGVWRWKQNRLMRYLCDKVNLNDVWQDFGQGKFSLEELVTFYMDIGYSLSGFGEVFGQAEAADWRLADAKKPDGNGKYYTQTPLEWVIDQHKEKV